MSSLAIRTFKKGGLLEWLLILYVSLGIGIACYCLSLDGEVRLEGFSVLGRYAYPTLWAVFYTHVDDALFSSWPAAIYWTTAATVLNGAVIYILLKSVMRLFRRHS
jgi:hypothetical protein